MNNCAINYLRLSKEDERDGESASITNQRRRIQQYCSQNGLILVKEFVDDDYSGGNFNRPGFQAMIAYLQAHPEVKIVITKDLSRLGRDMTETSYYAERYFPENDIRYLAIDDGFDSEKDNMMAPFQYALNDMYIRDVSKKVKNSLHTLMDNGKYCCAAPYGYKKDPNDIYHLVPDENTAPVVQEIFRLAASGESSNGIAKILSARGICPPMKYRRDTLKNGNLSNLINVSDDWNAITVRTILKNPVYLGHTALGKTKKITPKSNARKSLSKDSWRITKNTHEALVTAELSDLAKKNLANRRNDYRLCTTPRKNMFSGIAYCATCGRGMCSSGAVYKGEREQYWYLACQNGRLDVKEKCPTRTRIKYSLLCDIVARELRDLLALTQEEKDKIVKTAIELSSDSKSRQDFTKQLKVSEARLSDIQKVVAKIYEDMYLDKISREQAMSLIDGYDDERAKLEKQISEYRSQNEFLCEKEQQFEKFFDALNEITSFDALTRDLVLRLIDRIEIGPKVFTDGQKHGARSKAPFTQTVQIYYKFIGEIP